MPSEDQIDRIVREIAGHFRTFGGGLEPTNPFERNPITAALKDRPLEFAAGVKVTDVVRFVLEATAGER